MSETITHEVPFYRCPHCGVTHECATGIGDAKPDDGSLSICAGCGELSVFAADGNLRLADPMELLRFELSSVWPGVQRVQRKIKARRARQQ